MPGPKNRPGGSTAAHTIAPVKGDGESIVTAVEIVDDGSLDIPSTKDYVSMRMYRTKTADGVIEEPEWYWTKRGLSRWLSVCPKVAVRLDLDRDLGESDPKTARPLPVYYDGFRIDVPKGRTVMVAKPIADVIANMQTDLRTSQSQGIDLYRINPDDPTDYGYEIPALAAVSG